MRRLARRVESETFMQSNAHALLGVSVGWHPTKTAHAEIHCSQMIQFLLAPEANRSSGTGSTGCLLSAAPLLDDPRRSRARLMQPSLGFPRLPFISLAEAGGGAA